MKIKKRYIDKVNEVRVGDTEVTVDDHMNRYIGTGTIRAVVTFSVF
jgi:hypothetical protein